MAGQFPTTRWSIIANAGGQSPTERAEALARLCGNYWRPLFTYLRRTGMRKEDAEDTVQGFLASLMSGAGVGGAEPGRGQFRSYLLGALRNYVSNARAKANAKKRGGGTKPIPLGSGDDDKKPVEIPDARTPEHAFAQAWAQEILWRAHQRLRESYRASGKSAQFDALEPLLLSDAVPKYDDIGQTLSMTAAHARVAAHRMRTRFGRALREEVAETVPSPDDVETELRSILEAAGQ